MNSTSHRKKVTVCILCSLLLLGFVCRQALALDPSRDLSQFNRQVWVTENGLPQNTVHSIVQTQNGYIWIATEEGLARFDGVRFTLFDKQNTPALKSNDIRVLVADRRGGVCVWTARGVCGLLDAKVTPLSPPQG